MNRKNPSILKVSLYSDRKPPILRSSNSSLLLSVDVLEAIQEEAEEIDLNGSVYERDYNLSTRPSSNKSDAKTKRVYREHFYRRIKTDFKRKQKHGRGGRNTLSGVERALEVAEEMWDI